ncbi:MAG: NACHT domain-containing protein [Deltaproteobacteria bacterium]|nr:NACHT domain-containing protein [Deltaproteobacteria bacterium]
MNEMNKSESVPITDLIPINERLLIIGDPGAGKTTFMRLIAAVLSKDLLEGKSGRRDYLGLFLDKPAPVPILIRLTALAEALKNSNADVPSGESWRKLFQVMVNIYGKETARLLRLKLDGGEGALLLDGLDEVSEEYIRKWIVTVINSTLDHWGNNMIIISSRPFGYHDVAEHGNIETLHIKAFDKNEIEGFLYKWCQVIFHEDDEKSRSEHLLALQEAIINSPPIRKLARNPVMLTCLCVVHWNEPKQLSQGKIHLISAVLRWLLSAREENRSKRGFTTRNANECFKSIAMAMNCHPDGKQVTVDLSWAAEQLETPFSYIKNIKGGNRLRQEGIQFLEDEMLDSGIIEKSGRGQLRFWHLNFQEHYAAQALADRSDEDCWNIVEPQLCNQQWAEMLDHLVGCLADIGYYKLNLFLGKILSRVEHGNLASLACSVGVLGRLLRILEEYEYRADA